MIINHQNEKKINNCFLGISIYYLNKLTFKNLTNLTFEKFNVAISNAAYNCNLVLEMLTKAIGDIKKHMKYKSSKVPYIAYKFLLPELHSESKNGKFILLELCSGKAGNGLICWRRYCPPGLNKPEHPF